MNGFNSIIKAQGTDLIVNAKGSEADGIFAHFNVFIDGQKIGDSFTTSDYAPYIFKLSKDPSTIYEIHIEFDNDAAGENKDRNLYVLSIELNEAVILAGRGDNKTCILANGEVMDYKGIMPWNGRLIFKRSRRPFHCTGNITLSSQADVDIFNCIEVTGSLYISGKGITNLNGLSGLTKVYGDFEIYDNPDLLKIDGLPSVELIGGELSIHDNNSLTELTGFDNLITVEGIEIDYNKSLSIKEILLFKRRLMKSRYTN